ncbi:hypothetical protein F5Y16DRAFT_359533 [Xylariaceae sp. FL0255]|nr:hypothetical protein F5Y16DRAFT_359533 [Xylariaceae sp. FL0255]
MSSPIVLILGAGARVGASVAAKFASKNYKVAVAARKGTDSQTLEGYLSLKADFTEPSTIPALFEKVKSELGVPNVVVYNAAALTQPPDESSVLSIPSESVLADFNVNTLSAYVAAQEAVKGWSTLTENSKTLFIYTGNGLNTIVAPVPVFMNLGMGKSASAHFIGLADLTCKTKGYR